MSLGQWTANSGQRTERDSSSTVDRPLSTVHRLISILLVLLLPAALHATTVERLSFDQLVAKARSIVVGQVRRVDTRWSDDGKLILTAYTIEVQETLKGESAGTLTVTTIGGRIGNLIMHVAGMPAFDINERAVVFVEKAGAHNAVLGLGQGKFSIENGTVANRTDGLEFSDRRPAFQTRLPLDAFRTEIRRRLPLHR